VWKNREKVFHCVEKHAAARERPGFTS